MRTQRTVAVVLVGAGGLLATVGAGQAGAAGASPPTITRLVLGRPNLASTGGSSSIFLDVAGADTCWFTAPPAVGVDRSHRGCASGRYWTVVRLGRATAATPATYRITAWVRARDGATVRRVVDLHQAGFVPLGVSVSSAVALGEAVSEQLGATGGQGPYTLRVTAGALPPGLSLSPSGVLSGRPRSAGTYVAIVTISDSTLPRAERTTLRLRLEVTSPPVSVTTSALANGAENSPYGATLAAKGGTAPYRWSVVSGALPPGVDLAPSGVLAGTPTSAGTYTVTVRATDSASPPVSATRQLTLVVAAASLQITTAALPGATTGAIYVQTLAAVGGRAPYAWRVSSGSLPPGLFLSSNGVISGAPTVPGAYGFTVDVTDSSQPQQFAGRFLSISVVGTSGALAISSPAALPPATLGSSYAYTFTATGGTSPYSWHLVSGTLPPGMSFSATGLLAGTPTVAGTFSFTVQVYDSAAPAQTVSQVETLMVS